MSNVLFQTYRNELPCDKSFIFLRSIYFGLTIYLWNQSLWLVSFQRHHVDITKKLHPNQAGLDSKVPVGSQNDLVDEEKERSNRGATAVAGTDVTIGQLNHGSLTVHMTKVQWTDSYCYFVWNIWLSQSNHPALQITLKWSFTWSMMLNTHNNNSHVYCFPLLDFSPPLWLSWPIKYFKIACTFLIIIFWYFC